MAAPLSLEATVVPTRDLVSSALDDEVVILNLGDGAYYGLNPVAARIWELLHERRTVAAIRDQLLAEYDGVDVEDCSRAVLSLLDDLVTSGLARVEPQAGR